MTALRPPILSLGSEFYDPVTAANFPKTILRYHNTEAAKLLGLNNLNDQEWVDHFGCFTSLPGNLAEPLALRYHGHQFSHYNPDLGDGRGFLFAQYKVQNKLYDLGTKGSGQTPYSRQGDGRLTLKGAYREIIATEILQSYGINTSQTFSVIETGEKLVRNDEPSPTRSAVLVRLCHGHIRFGSFQRLAYLQQNANIQKLTDYCVQNFYPEIHMSDPDEKASALLQAVLKKSADLVASWMMVGFVHGVMNTDNMNISGECFDYGPYRFIPKYDPNFTAAYFDHQGLYRFGRQPVTMLWNLEQLAKSLQVAYPNMIVSETLESFGEEFNASVKRHFLKRLNLNSNGNDQELLGAFFQFIEAAKILFEQTFFDLHSGIHLERLQRSPQKEAYESEAFENLKKLLKTYSVLNLQLVQHEYFQQPNACTLLIDEIENIWKPITENDDWSSFHKKLQSIRSIRGIYEP